MTYPPGSSSAKQLQKLCCFCVQEALLDHGANEMSTSSTAMDGSDELDRDEIAGAPPHKRSKSGSVAPEQRHANLDMAEADHCLDDFEDEGSIPLENTPSFLKGK